MSDKMMGEMKSRLREIMKGKPVGSPNAKEIEDMIVQVGEDMGVFKKAKPKKMKDGGAVRGAGAAISGTQFRGVM